MSLMDVVIDTDNSVIDIDIKEFGRSINAIKTAWNKKDYGWTAGECRKLLEHEPENIYGLMYLARAAAFTGDWPDLISAGGALTRRSPRDAFNAARKLNRNGQSNEAAIIFADLDIRPDWFDAKISELAGKEGAALFKAGQLAFDMGNIESAKILWVGGVHIAPANQNLRQRVADFALQTKEKARGQNLDEDSEAYLKAWREVLWFNRSDAVAASKIARGCERINEADAISAWVRLLAIEPLHEGAIARLRKLVGRFSMEDHALRALVEAGRDENSDPLMREFAGNRDVKARMTLERALKDHRRDALMQARAADRERDPRHFMEAWKSVLVLDPRNLGAARKIISAARELGDYSELVEGAIAYLEIVPGDPAMAQRLAGAALRAGHEQRALEYLARHDLADMSVRQIAGVHKRVLQACKNAMRALDFDHALDCFCALELVDQKHPEFEALRATLAKRAASAAKIAEKQGDFIVAVPLAAKILRIAPDQPAALTIVARDLWRHKQFDDLVKLCGSRVKSGREYASVQKLLDQAAIRLRTRADAGIAAAA